MTLSAATMEALTSFSIPLSCARREQETATLAGYEDQSKRRSKWYRLRTPEGKDMPLRAPDVAWFLETALKLVSLDQLQPDWDGYGAPRIEQHPIVHAIRLLAEITQDNTPAPYVFPTSNGGVQFEWHTEKGDLEVEVTGDLKLLVLFDDVDGNEHDWEMNPASMSDLGKLVECVRELT